MNKVRKDLISDLAYKMGENDTSNDYRTRQITEFAEQLEKLFAIPDVKVRSSMALLQWLEDYPKHILAELINRHGISKVCEGFGFNTP